jgi:hypothetical protein
MFGIVASLAQANHVVRIKQLFLDDGIDPLPVDWTRMMHLHLHLAPFSHAMLAMALGTSVVVSLAYSMDFPGPQ